MHVSGHGVINTFLLALLFAQLDVEAWQQEQPVVLHTWTKESAHNYENNCHEVSVFVSPGATYFEVEFDERCETEKR